MRTRTYFLLIAFSLAFFIPKSQAQNFYDRGPMLSFYMGTDWYKTIYRSSYPDTLNIDNQRFEITHLSSSGSWGGKLEQMITRRFGVALDLWYAQTNVSAICYQRIDSSAYIDPITGYIKYPKHAFSEESAYFSKRLSRLNVTLRFDLHVGRSKVVDPYFHFALGGSLYNLLFTTSDASIYNEDTFFAPVSLKLGSGIRFFVSKHVGIFTELSVGGPIIVGGVSYKFLKKEQEAW